MEEALAVIARLDRIEALALERAPARLILDELELLLPEARRWLDGEGPAAADARSALERCLAVLEDSARRSVTVIAASEHSLV